MNYQCMSVAVLLAGCLSAAATLADSFGLSMGLPVEDIATAKDEGSPAGMLRLLSVAEPNESYETYLGQFSDVQGLCWIKAIGLEIPSDSKGTQVRALFAKETLRLAKMFGEAKDFDFRFSGRSDADLDNWLQAISDGDRYVAAIWDSSSGALLPENLRSVGLVLNAYSLEVGYLSLEYTFENINLCERELYPRD